ncbi:hypothetical protein HanHA89_Chr08g0306161 [Helianthus annuus]|nr:hypothetical protein HanHA89_Chr08g0306161 [Helianthus annuus]
MANSLWIKVHLPRYLLSVVELLEFVGNLRIPSNKLKAIYLVVAAVCWSLWLARNETIFRNRMLQVFNVIGEDKTLSFLWISSRAAKIKVEWKNGVSSIYVTSNSPVSIFIPVLYFRLEHLA